MRKFHTLIPVFLLSAALLALTGCGKTDPAPTEQPPAEAAPALAQAVEGSWDGEDYSTLSFRSDGTVTLVWGYFDGGLWTVSSETTGTFTEEEGGESLLLSFDHDDYFARMDEEGMLYVRPSQATEDIRYIPSGKPTPGVHEHTLSDAELVPLMHGLWRADDGSSILFDRDSHRFDFLDGSGQSLANGFYHAWWREVILTDDMTAREIHCLLMQDGGLMVDQTMYYPTGELVDGILADGRGPDETDAAPAEPPQDLSDGIGADGRGPEETDGYLTDGIGADGRDPEEGEDPFGPPRDTRTDTAGIHDLLPGQWLYADGGCIISLDGMNCTVEDTENGVTYTGTYSISDWIIALDCGDTVFYGRVNDEDLLIIDQFPGYFYRADMR